MRAWVGLLTMLSLGWADDWVKLTSCSVPVCCVASAVGQRVRELVQRRDAALERLARGDAELERLERLHATAVDRPPPGVP